MNNFKKIILFSFVFCILFTVTSVVSAKVQLEVEFPSISGSTLTATSTLPQTIKYVFNIALVIIFLIIVITLIYSGFTYLTSTGNPAKIASSKKQLTGSLLGLAILLSSYLVFRIINPDFLILTINKVPVVTGILFLNDEVFKPANTNVILDLMSSNEDTRNKKIRELLSNPSGKPRAVYMAWNKLDLRDKFGLIEVDFNSPLVAVDEKFDSRFKYKPVWEDSEDTTKKYNFQDFKLYGLLFLPNADIKVTTYFFADFNQDIPVDKWFWIKQLIKVSTYQNPNASIFQKLLNRLDKLAHTDIINEYTYPNCSALSGGPCKFKMLDGIFENGNFEFNKKSVPLSLRVEYVGKGVYLKSDKFSQELPVLKYTNNILDLGIYDFNDKAEEIEIRNWDFEHFQDDGGTPSTIDDINELRGKKIKNYLTILHEDKWFRGNLRIFFEKFESIQGTWIRYIGNLNSLAVSPEIDSFVRSGTVTVESLQSKIEIKNEIDTYGKVNKPSSVQVFEMPQTEAEKAQWKLQGGCRVHLCAGIAIGSLNPFFSNCLVYNFTSLVIPAGILENNNPIDGGAPNLFEPFNIPKKADVEIDDGILGITTAVVDFEDKIRSMKIEGNCAVVLFENRVGTAFECLQNSKDCWDKGEPGSRSEVFGPQDSEYPVYKNLHRSEPTIEGPRHPIGHCGMLVGTWLNKTGNPCASAIAVFPIKP